MGGVLGGAPTLRWEGRAPTGCPWPFRECRVPVDAWIGGGVGWLSLLAQRSSPATGLLSARAHSRDAREGRTRRHAAAPVLWVGLLRG